MYWFEAMGEPNCVRLLANFMHSSSRRCISPTIMVKMQRISQVITCSIMKNEPPGLPIRFSFGTRQSLNSIEPIGDVFSPIFGIGSLTSISTTKALMPVAPASG